MVKSESKRSPRFVRRVHFSVGHVKTGNITCNKSPKIYIMGDNVEWARMRTTN